LGFESGAFNHSATLPLVFGQQLALTKLLAVATSGYCFDAVRMKESDATKSAVRQQTPYVILVRYLPSRKYFARLRVHGKLIRRCLKTNKISVAKLRLADLEKVERSVLLR